MGAGGGGGQGCLKQTAAVGAEVEALAPGLAPGVPAGKAAPPGG